MKFEISITITSKRLAQWASANLQIVGLGSNAQDLEELQAFIEVNPPFRARLLSLYAASISSTPLSSKPGTTQHKRRRN